MFQCYTSGFETSQNTHAFVSGTKNGKLVHGCFI